MQVQVKLGEPLWRAIGRRRVTLTWPDGAEVTVVDVLARLAAEDPAFEAAYSGESLSSPAPYRLFVDSIPVETACLPPGPVLVDWQTLFILLPAIGG